LGNDGLFTIRRFLRVPFWDGLRDTAEAVEESFHASFQSAFGPRCPKCSGVLERGVAVQEGPHRYGGGGVIRLSGDAAYGVQ
jgi:hypothetical protein